MFGSRGWRCNKSRGTVLDQATFIDDSVWPPPEENDLRRRFLSDEGTALTLLFRFENGRASERDPLALMVNKSPLRFLFS